MKKVLASVFSLMFLAGFAIAISNCGGDDGDDPETKDCKVLCETPECGDVDGCNCGECGADETCEANMCVAPRSDDCVDACKDADGVVLECGDGDGVEGCSCGTCGEGFECGADQMCHEEGTEPDCTTICTDIKCGTVDECDCPNTCAEGEECDNSNLCVCVPNCKDADGNALECGDDGCGGSCGDCQYGDCDAGVCPECVPDCTDKECGMDGCGGECGECADGKQCDFVDNTCKDKGECTYTGPVLGQKLVYMEIGKGGHAGEAIDVDGDDSTCAPVGDCEDGLNNQLSGLLGQLEQFVDADAEIANAMLEGSIILLVEFMDKKDDGTEFVMNMYIGEAKEPVETCDFQSALCDYYIKADSLDPFTCKPIIFFDNTTITDGKLAGGGPDALFKISIPIQEGLILDVVANMAQIVADVNGEGEAMMLENGLIGGAVRKDALMEAVEYLPEDIDLPVSKDMIKNLLDMFITPDVDTDDDGEMDGASIGVKFSSIAGTIQDLEPAGE